MEEFEARAKEVYFQITIVKKDEKVSNEVDYILHKMREPTSYKFQTEQEADEFAKGLNAEGVLFYENKVIKF